MAEETGIADVADPLGGSYYVEWLTDEMEQLAYEYLARIEELGGVLAAIKKGFIQREIADTSYKYQQQMEEKTRLVVGVNSHNMSEASPIETLRVNETVRNHQMKRLREVKKSRDATAVRNSLDQLQKAFNDPEANYIYPMLRAVRSYATLGEIVEVGRQVFGEWKEPSIL
jgi:methylmalonyl-CoA mutase N-terminal domain/subunit